MWDLNEIVVMKSASEHVEGVLSDVRWLGGKKGVGTSATDDPFTFTTLQRKYADKKLLEQVQITTSVPEKIPLHPSKPNILWQKHSYDQPNIAPWFNQKTNHNKYDWYVFNSHWCYEKYRYHFNIPTNRCVVIKNGIDKIQQSGPYQEGQPIKIIHQNTPWRGLSILLGAMQLVKNPLVTLDVYSSTEVYGKEFYAK